MSSESTTNQQRKLTGTKVGTVVSDKRNKSRTVVVAYAQRHPKYGKFLRRETRYQIHDESNTCKMGDRVEIAPCRAVSKTKSWRLVKVVESALPPVSPVAEPEIAGLTKQA